MLRQKQVTVALRRTLTRVSTVTILILCSILLAAAQSEKLSIQTKDSLQLQQGTYSSLFFSTGITPNSTNNLPIQYQFKASGPIPPGMIFESYPCNKPGQTACSQIAAANGIYLDGTPTQAGSYTFVITVTGGEGKTGSQQFTLIVTPPISPHSLK